jgi:hypothetical protein
MLPWTSQDRFALQAAERRLAEALGALPGRVDLLALNGARATINSLIIDVGEMLAGGDAGDDPAQARNSLVAVLARVRDDPGGLTPGETAALRGAVLPALVRAAEGRHPGGDRLDRLDAELRGVTLAEVAREPKADPLPDERDRFQSVNPSVPAGTWYEPGGVDEAEFGPTRWTRGR